MAPRINQPLSIRTLSKAMRKMKLSDNCVVMVKRGSDLATSERLKTLENTIALAQTVNVVIVVVDDFGDLKAIDKETMGANGWYYIDSIRRKLFKNKDTLTSDA
ncbi:hypothetical protein LCGC14_1892870 [marine sediment metagenome]|uniref:Uncharacterized protein n=1 Tax=marine sediment metagenome TaxID=412755 RepID=A0A0F9IWZ6_9ZZZZ